MNFNDANEVANAVLETSCLHPTIKLLGNRREYVVIVSPPGGDFYLWNIADWEDNKSKWAKFLSESGQVKGD